VNTLVSAPTNRPGDTILWESFDASGWHALELFYASSIPIRCGELDYEAWKKKKGELLHAACIRFAKALKFVGSGSARSAQSSIGLAWTEYLQLLQNKPAEPQVTHASQVTSLLGKSMQAMKILESSDLDQSERQVLGFAYQLVAELELEACQGAKSEGFLEKAATIYLALGMQRRYCDVQHLRGKLRQCQQRFIDSLKFFQDAETSTDMERRVRAFLGRVNTLHWLGRTREAWQNFSTWNLHKKSLSEIGHGKLLLRGRMLFASIATRFGNLDKADELLCEIEMSSLCRSGLSEIGNAVYRVLRAEHCLERGDILGMEKHLDGVTWKTPVPRDGYDCFEILFLGSGCRQCIAECWTCETWCCDVCGNCVPQLVVFQTDTKLVPVDIQRMLTLMMDGLHGKGHYANGDLRKAEERLTVVVRELPSVFPADSTVVLPVLVALLQVLQARDNDGERIHTCCNEILERMNSPDKKRTAILADVERVLGLWRSELSEDDVAKKILEDSLRHSLQVRDKSHPEVLALQAEIMRVTSQLPSRDLSELPKQIEKIVEQLSRVVDCLDHRLLAAIRTAAWISLLSHCYGNAIHCFTRLEQMWLALQRRNHASIEAGDSRVILGRVAAQIESGTPIPEVTEQLFRGIQHITVSSNLSSLAHDLNRISVILAWHQCFQSAYYFARKSLDQYESMGDASSAGIIKNSIKTIRSEAVSAGVEIEEF
jgi:hypothetical protein